MSNLLVSDLKPKHKKAPLLLTPESRILGRGNNETIVPIDYHVFRVKWQFVSLQLFNTFSHTYIALVISLPHGHYNGPDTLLNHLNS